MCAGCRSCPTCWGKCGGIAASCGALLLPEGLWAEMVVVLHASPSHGEEWRSWLRWKETGSPRRRTQGLHDEPRLLQADVGVFVVVVEPRPSRSPSPNHCRSTGHKQLCS